MGSCFACVSCRRATVKEAPGRLRRTEPAKPVEAAGGGFMLEISSADRSWQLAGTAPSHSVGAVLARLESEVPGVFGVRRAALVYKGVELHDDELIRKRVAVGVEAALRSSPPGPRLSRVHAIFSDLKAAALIIGGGVAGKRAAKELSALFPNRLVVVADRAEYSEHACGVLRAFADPALWESLVVRHEDALSQYPNVRFAQGECVRLRPGFATFASPGDGSEFNVRFEFCLVTAGCGWASDAPGKGSLWQPSFEGSLEDSANPGADERTVAGRRSRVLEEHRRLWALHDGKRPALVVGADALGVQWACDLEMHFPDIQVTLVDALPRCLGNLPPSAAEHAEDYMQARGIRTFYSVRYDPESADFWARVGLPNDTKTYVLQGVASQNAFMPPTTLSARGPGGGGWIIVNSCLQVCAKQKGDRSGQAWADGRIFAAGDCQLGAVHGDTPASADADFLSRFKIPPVPKTALAAAAWATLACRNIAAIHGTTFPRPLDLAAWPREAGIAVVGLGASDGVVVWKADWSRDSGEVVLKGAAAAEAKRRLSWPEDRDWVADPSRWLATFREGLPSGQLFAERGRAALGLPGRAW